MGNAIFQGIPAPEPLNRFSKKFSQLITSVTPPHTQKLGSVGQKGACLRMREIVIVRRLFLGFLPARRYASAGNRHSNVSVRLSVCHAPVLCQNEEN